MHPDPRARGSLALYLGLWVIVGLLLAGLLAGAERASDGSASAMVALPLATAFSFVCLSAWYVARGMPLATTGALPHGGDGDHRVARSRAPSGW